MKRNFQIKTAEKTVHLRPVYRKAQPSTFPYIIEITGMPFSNIDIHQNICFTSYVKPVVHDFIKSMLITTNMAGHLSLIYFWSQPRWLSWMRVRLVIRRLRVQPPPGRQHSFVEIDNEIFSMVILSLPLIQEVSGERMCTILINRLED